MWIDAGYPWCFASICLNSASRSFIDTYVHSFSSEHQLPRPNDCLTQQTAIKIPLSFSGRFFNNLSLSIPSGFHGQKRETMKLWKKWHDICYRYWPLPHTVSLSARKNPGFLSVANVMFCSRLLYFTHSLSLITVALSDYATRAKTNNLINFVNNLLQCCTPRLQCCAAPCQQLLSTMIVHSCLRSTMIVQSLLTMINDLF